MDDYADGIVGTADLRLALTNVAMIGLTASSSTEASAEITRAE